MSYGDLIRDAFRITWRNKFLWFFGFFVGGAASNIGGNIPSSGGNINRDDFDQSGFPLSTAQIGQGVLDNVALIVALVALALLIALVVIILAIISQGGLAESVAAIDRGETRRFSSTWRAGLGNFWRVLGYYILFFLMGLGLLIVIGAPVAGLIGGTFALTESLAARISVAVLAGLVGILALIVVFIALSIIGQYALREIAVRGERVVGSVGSGYRIFRGNIGRSLLVWLINIGLSIAMGIAILIAAVIVGLILFAPTIALAFAEYATAAIITGIVAGLILIPLFIVASAALGTFGHTYWTLAYLRVSTPAEPNSEVAQG